MILLALLLMGTLLGFAPDVAYASATICTCGSCESVAGTGLTINTTSTYAQVSHCNETIGTIQWDQKGYMTTYSIAPYLYQFCSNAGMSGTWNTTLPQSDNVYGQSYFGAKWQGIATVNIH